MLVSLALLLELGSQKILDFFNSESYPLLGEYTQRQWVLYHGSLEKKSTGPCPVTFSKDIKYVCVDFWYYDKI